jgi:hypothetical protein
MISIAKIIHAKPDRRFMRWAQHVFIICGISAFSYIGLTLFSAKIYQKNAKLTL